jgi:hypothetical protein
MAEDWHAWLHAHPKATLFLSGFVVAVCTMMMTAALTFEIAGRFGGGSAPAAPCNTSQLDAKTMHNINLLDEGISLFFELFDGILQFVVALASLNPGITYVVTIMFLASPVLFAIGVTGWMRKQVEKLNLIERETLRTSQLLRGIGENFGELMTLNGKLEGTKREIRQVEEKIDQWRHERSLLEQQLSAMERERDEAAMAAAARSHPPEEPPEPIE